MNLNGAINLANEAYSYGIDAIIVQDLGLARYLITHFPDLDVHASTQMTIHSLEGAQTLEKLGFKRIVLSRELSLEEIKFICENTNVEIEVFAHGALCISYSGRCYISSMIGGRSGNRGKCAQACRLPYKLIDRSFSASPIDSGYLISPRDLCSLKYLPQLISAGIDCLKIEGRMKSPEYVATVTNIYRRYIDMAFDNSANYSISKSDMENLMQVFNRGGFSNGHLESTANTNLVFPERPNNIGLYLGKIKKFQDNKGYISLIPEEKIEIGDTISVEKENNKYTVSELIKNNQNIKFAQNEYVTIGRMKGNISIGDKVYKMSSKELSKQAKASYEKEFKKIPIDCKLTVIRGKPITITVFSSNPESIYYGCNITEQSNIIPEIAQTAPLTKERLIESIKKTGNTQFEFENISIELDENTYIPRLSALNELRRNILSKFEKLAVASFSKELQCITPSKLNLPPVSSNKYISLLLNNLDITFDYSKLKNVDYIYIPLKYFLDLTYFNKIHQLKNVYVYLPSIIRKNRAYIIKNSIKEIVKNFNIKGFVLSNISDFKLLPQNKQFEIIADYTLNIFNSNTFTELTNLGFSRITASPELSKFDYNSISSSKLEAIVYGKLPVMTLNYCLLGKTNHCYHNCGKKCQKSSYFLRDRVDLNFPIIIDPSCTVTTIYNSKTTSIVPSIIPANTYRIDILDEKIDEIINIIDLVRNNSRLEGKNYSNNNLNRDI